MRLKDVNAAELTEQVGFEPGPGGLAPDTSAGCAATSEAEPLLLTQEVPLELMASEFEPRSDGGGQTAPIGGLRGLIHVQWVRWSEKRHAQKTTRRVVERYRDIVARYPELPTRDALCLLVMEHLRCSDSAARRVLGNAENSFSSWSGDRSLNLVDVAHYLAVSEFLALHQREHGIRGDIGQLVAALVPRDLLARPRS